MKIYKIISKSSKRGIDKDERVLLNGFVNPLPFLKYNRGFVPILAAVVIGIIVIVGAIYLVTTKGTEKLGLIPKTNLPTETFKILHVMSYHTPWEWTEDQLRGFKEALKDLKVEYKVYEMDTKRKSTEEWKQQAGKEAKKLVEDWKPDLVFTSDDNAQKYFAKDYVNASIPFVFSAVNSDPSVYGYVGSSNMTGVLEHEHFVETVKLLKQVAPNVKKIVVIYDDDPTWDGVTKRMKTKLDQLPGMEFVAWEKITTFDQYKKTVFKYQDKADALALLGVHTFKDAKGNNILWQDVLKWTTENSKLPDFTFWRDRIDYGTLVTVAVSGYEQGLTAGKLARKILVDGVSPKDIEMSPTLKGKPVISLARAKKLGLKVPTSLLSSLEVVDKFGWEK